MDITKAAELRLYSLGSVNGSHMIWHFDRPVEYCLRQPLWCGRQQS